MKCTYLYVNDVRITIIRKNIKHLYVAILPPDGWVRVTVPSFLGDTEVIRAVQSKINWIKAKQDRYVQQGREAEKTLEPGEELYYLGALYRLELVNGSGPPSVSISGDQTLVLRAKANAGFEQKARVLMRWYRAELHAIIITLIAKWESVMNLRVGSWGIKRMKTRWGSCNPSTKRIWLNLELIKKPIECIEYVVVHEIVHFLEASHNHVFKGHMDRLLPQWRSLRKTLNAFPLPVIMDGKT